MKIPFVSEKRQQPSKPDYYDHGGAGHDPCGEGQAILGLSDLYVPEDSVDAHVRDAADVLLDMGRITPEQQAQVRKEQSERPGTDAATLLLKAGFCRPEDILAAKAEMCGLEFRRINPSDVEEDAFKKLDIDFIKSSSICPVAVQEDTLVIATSEPANVFAIEEVKRQTQMDLQVLVCAQEDIDSICDAQGGIDEGLDDIISDMTDVEVVQDREDENEDLEKMAGQSPVIKFVNYLISNAIHEGASDIHIEPKEKFTKTRYRIDGVLFETKQAPLKMHPAVVSRIKIMANLDISERRVPQDGKISVIVGRREIDLRVSTLPTNHGEKVVIRVLDRQSIFRGLEQLGMESDVMNTFAQQVTLPHGILLVTGPTGSGKSTTLYSSL